MYYLKMEILKVGHKVFDWDDPILFLEVYIMLYMHRKSLNECILKKTAIIFE